MPAVPWLGLNYAFPLRQDILLRPWLKEEVEILEEIREPDEQPVVSQETLAKAGFERSFLDISSKRRDLGLSHR